MSSQCKPGTVWETRGGQIAIVVDYYGDKGTYPHGIAYVLGNDFRRSSFFQDGKWATHEHEYDFMKLISSPVDLEGKSSLETFMAALEPILKKNQELEKWIDEINSPSGKYALLREAQEEAWKPFSELSREEERLVLARELCSGAIIPVQYHEGELVRSWDHNPLKGYKFTHYMYEPAKPRNA